VGIQVLSALIGQAPVEPDPEIVTPGALGLAIVLMLGLAIFLLFRSMNRHIRKVDVPPAGDEDSNGDAPDRPQ
jgi:hypothetical protein